MYGIRRRTLSQNFLHSRKLVHRLVRQSSIGKNDRVVEIGPGKGIITRELLEIAYRVTAVEIDSRLCSYLSLQFKKAANLNIINADFLFYALPSGRYKIFANIPFSIEGKIIRKLLHSWNPPVDCYLVLRKDLAVRLGGFYKECMFSISQKPWFSFEILHYFCRTDFTPFARMDTVLLRISKKEKPLIPIEETKRFRTFVRQGFEGGKNLKTSLRPYFNAEQIQRLSGQLDFKIKNSPSELSLNQWIALYNTV